MGPPKPPCEPEAPKVPLEALRTAKEARRQLEFAARRANAPEEPERVDGIDEAIKESVRVIHAKGQRTGISGLMRSVPPPPPEEGFNETKLVSLGFVFEAGDLTAIIGRLISDGVDLPKYLARLPLGRLKELKERLSDNEKRRLLSLYLINELLICVQNYWRNDGKMTIRHPFATAVIAVESESGKRLDVEALGGYIEALSPYGEKAEMDGEINGALDFLTS